MMENFVDSIYYLAFSGEVEEVYIDTSCTKNSHFILSIISAYNSWNHKKFKPGARVIDVLLIMCNLGLYF